VKSFLTAYEVAQALKVSRVTVIRWIHKGLFVGAKKPEDSQAWQIPITSFGEFVKTQNESY